MGEIADFRGSRPVRARWVRWLLIAVGLMLFGMATRISGDFWQKILASHYIYGALLWVAGVLLWAIYVLPKVFVIERDPA